MTGLLWFRVCPLLRPLNQEIYALISHVSRYSEAVDHLMITILRLFYQDHYIHASHATLNPIDYMCMVNGRKNTMSSYTGNQPVRFTGLFSAN